MKIGVISDTHDRLPTFRRAMEMFKRLKVDAVFHAGDFVAPFAAKLLTAESVGKLPVACVYGNNDGEREGLKKLLPQLVDGPLKVTFQVDGKPITIVMHHFLDWMKPADYADADIVITGHTHEVVNEVRDGKLFLNPGECCGWVTGRCTVAMLDLTKPLDQAAQIVDIHD